MHATSITYTSPKTPTCEVPSNGVVVSTLHGALKKIADLRVNEHQKIRHYRARSTEKEEEEGEIAIFYFARCVRKIVLYSDVIHSIDWKSAVEHDGGI